MSASGSPRRALTLVVLGGLLVAGVVADRLPRPSPGAGADEGPPMPVAAPARAISSSWFCAGGTGSGSGPAEGTVTVANAGPEAVSGTITVVPDEGDPLTLPLSVGPWSRAVIRQRDLVSAPFLATTVEMDGGEVVVEHEISGPLGSSVAPCASAASDRWHLAEGSTALGDTMLLALYNPFPEDAIIDLAFSTDQGRAVPSDFTGIVVRGRRLGVVDVGQHVRRRTNVAVTASARTGRIVMDRIQLRESGTRGLSLALAAPSPGQLWYFPEGLVADGLAERFHLYNPSDEEALVSIELTLEEGAAEPIDVTIPAQDRVTVVAGDEERVPKGVGHSALVRSRNGVAVVAERSVAAAPPSPRSGTSDSLGSRLTARRWALASGSASDSVDEWVTVLNPGPVAAVFSVRALASGQLLAVDGLQEVTVEAGQRRAVRMTDHIKRDDLGLLVESSLPVVVERGLYGASARTLALSAGIPLR